MHFVKLSIVITFTAMLFVSVQANPIPDIHDDGDYNSHEPSEDSHNPHLLKNMVKFEEWAMVDKKFNDYITKALEDFQNGDNVDAKSELVKAAVEVAFKYKDWSKLLSDGESLYAEYSHSHPHNHSSS